MKHTLYIFLFLVIAVSLYGQHINGLTIVGSPSEYESDPYPRIVKSEANWICLVPYGFTRLGQTEIFFNLDNQWWGEKKVGVVENIKLAKAQGLKIFLKPQIYIPGSWPGGLDYEEQDWKIWEANYKKFIEFYIDIAIEYEVDMFCVGTEFKISEQKRSFFWSELIESIRCNYSGLITYSSNWDSFDEVSFWDKLDYVGISGYFPISDKKRPKDREFDKKWQEQKHTLRTFAKAINKKILFTEYGYLSVEGCAGKTWELEKKVAQLEIDETAQANAFEALYRNLWHEDFWAGGFIWKWFPNDKGHEGYIPKDYTPKNKEAEKVISDWFGKENR